MDAVNVSSNNGVFTTETETPKPVKPQALFIHIKNMCINTAYIVSIGEYGKQQTTSKSVKLKYALSKGYISPDWMSKHGSELINPTGNINTSLACQAYDILVGCHPDVANYYEYEITYRLTYIIPHGNSSSANYIELTKEQYDKICQYLDMIIV
jgi:hypothetical protein